ncbi:hypothetical protein K474DRAFT_661247 [Panus rudis PR-1116 ss-1]|nr:hypothetical protein K474DRAFT_661247 [Panus rudis PR-1116 ss-1]
MLGWTRHLLPLAGFGSLLSMSHSYWSHSYQCYSIHDTQESHGERCVVFFSVPGLLKASTISSLSIIAGDTSQGLQRLISPFPFSRMGYRQPVPAPGWTLRLSGSRRMEDADRKSMLKMRVLHLILISTSHRSCIDCTYAPHLSYQPSCQRPPLPLKH